jgi:hypothetical protein
LRKIQVEPIWIKAEKEKEKRQKHGAKNHQEIKW